MESRIKLIAVAFATLITTIAVVMAGLSAWSRGGTDAERVLLVAISVCVCLGAHLIPSLSQKGIAWILWGGCLCAAIYSHLTFITIATMHAGEIRAQSSIQVSGVAEQVEERRNAMLEIKARPVAVVASELANCSDPRMKMALRAELAEARRAAVLRDELVRLSDTVTSTKKSQSSDPVTSLLSSVTGGNAQTIELLIWGGMSVLVELLGVFMWYQVLNPSGSNEQDSSSKPIESNEIDRLRTAIEVGDCKPTVSGIRKFMGCRQDRAVLIRRVLYSQ